MDIHGWPLKAIFHYNDYYRDQFVLDTAKSLPPGSKVLDAGAGPCRYRQLFAHCDYKSQDFAGYEGEEHHYGKLDYVGDITAIPVADGYFDCVLCAEVLEHLPEPQAALKEFSRIVKPGGTLVLTAPLGSGIHMAPYHFYGGFTPHWYNRFLSEYGFQIESCVPNHGFFKLYGQESQRFLHLLTPHSPTCRVLFFPAKVLLAIWFKLLIPVVCHFLDPLDTEKAFTAGYFVAARRK